MKPLLLLAAYLIPFFVSAQQIAKSLTAANGKLIGFYEYKPSDYSANTTTKYPLIIFLHGIGERGNGTTELYRAKLLGIPRNIDLGHKMTFTWNGKTETFLVLTPQCSKTDSLWYSYYIDEMLSYAKQNLRVDTNRIFLTGLSMGGGGTWGYASSSIQNASKFAGIAPVCGPCLMASGSNIANGKTPVYAFHALDDKEFWAPPSCTINALDSINKYNPVNKPIATLYPTGGHAIWAKAYDTVYRYQNPSIYEWFLSQDRRLLPNKHPKSNAGKDTLIHSASGKAILNGSGSNDPDGTIARYIWRKISGPSSGSLSNATQAIATVTTQRTAGIYLFELKVIDNRANWSLDTMKIEVNTSPIANAGADVLISLPTNSTNLNGSSSSDADGTITNYKWTWVSGPTSYTIVNSVAANTAVTNLIKGTYRFRLTITDNKGGTAFDEVIVTVNAQPLAKAGADSVINLPRNSTTLKGTSSTDPDGSIASYLWTKVSGPTTYALATPTASTTSLSNLVNGIYLFRLQVTDNRGATGADTVKITVNKPPIAKAGSDSTIKLPRNYTTLRGTGSSDPDGSISTYAWTKIAGPSSSSINTPTSSTTSVTNLVQGIYQFKLTVKDNLGALSSDTVLITVNPATAQSFPGISADETTNRNEELRIFPQLANDIIEVRLRSNVNGKTVLSITNMNGQKLKRVVFDKKTERLQGSVTVSDLPPGLYNVEVRIKNSTRFVSRFLKQ